MPADCYKRVVLIVVLHSLGKRDVCWMLLMQNLFLCILRPIMGLLTGLGIWEKVTTSDTGAGPGEGQLRSQLTSCW